MTSIRELAVAVVGIAALALCGSERARAAEDDLKHLQETLTLINQEQQAVYQQFQMIQQLRRANAEPVVPPVGGGPPGNYDDVVAAKRSQAEREESYARELEELYRRHRELEREKRPIVENLRRLRQEKARAP